jgi:hypothetical protein
MIVRKKDRGAPVVGRIDHDFAKGEIDAGCVPVVAREVQALRLVIEMRHPQAFTLLGLFGEAASEEVTGRGDARELQRNIGTLIPHRTHLSKRRSRFDEKRIQSG